MSNEVTFKITRRAFVSASLLLPNQASTDCNKERIFSTDSAWNKAITFRAFYRNVGAVAEVDVGIDAWDAANAWTIPTYRATAADPRQPLLYNSQAWSQVATGVWRRFGNTDAAERSILDSSSDRFPYAGNVFSSTSPRTWQLPHSFNRTVNPVAGPAAFRLGANAIPASGSDGHMAVFQPDGKVLETYAAIRLSSGQLVALSYSVTDPAGLGDGWQNGQTASMLPIYAGLIRDGELRATIPHAMAITLPPRLLAVSFVYPAFAFDRDAARSYGGPIPMGGRLALPRSIDVRKLDLTTMEGNVIAAAARRYGFIVVDRGGEGVTLRMHPGDRARPSPSEGGTPSLQADLRRIFAHVQQVDTVSSAPTAGAGR